MVDPAPAARAEPATPDETTGAALPARALLALIVAAVVVLTLGLNALPLTDPDEVFYAQTAREMLDHHSVLTPLLFGQPQFEKPPLTYWLLMASFEAFGRTPWAARLVPELAGLLAALAVYLLARRLASRETALLAALIQLTGLLCLGQSIVLLTDMVFTAFLALAFLALHGWSEDGRGGRLHLFGLWLGLAVLTKGPVGLVIALLAAVLYLRLAGRTSALWRWLAHPWWLTFAAVAAPWYVWAAARYGRAFSWEFLVHDNWDRILRAEHANFDNWGFYPAVIVAGMLPWTPLLAWLGAGWRRRRAAIGFLLCWIGSVYAIFSVAHSKLASYILPLFPALAVLLALSLEDAAASRRRTRVAAALFAVLGVVFAALPWLVRPPFAVEFRATILAAAAFGAVQLVVAALLLRRRFAPAILVNAAAFLVVIAVALTTVPASATRGFTGADLPALVARYGLQGQPIVSSKLHARDVLFYTGNPVVVMDRNEHPFWSDHPVEVLWRDEQIRAFFAARPRVLCTIRPGDVERLNRLFPGQRTNTVLSSDFDRIVVLSAEK